MPQKDQIKFLNILEITVERLKEISHIIVLLSSFAFLLIFVKVYPEKNALFGIIVGIILTFGIGYFILHSNYEKLEKLYNEEKEKNKEWESYRSAALNSINSTWRLVDINNNHKL